MQPPVDVFENEQQWLITADLPGVIQDALALHLDKDELVLEARRDKQWTGTTHHAGYRRAFTLPSGIDAQKVTAQLKLGVVTIQLPKAEAIKPRRIQVKAG